MKRLFLISLVLFACGTMLSAQILDLLLPQPAPATDKEAFLRYFRGGFLSSGSYYQYLEPGQAIDHLEAVGVNVFRYSWSKFPTQVEPTPSPVVTLGILDNVSILQGALLSDTKTTYFADLISLTGAYTMPLMGYKAFVNTGVKTALNYNMPFGNEIDALNTKLAYATGFSDTNGERTTAYTEDQLGASAEAFVKGGIRVYQNWFVSLGLGLRVISTPSGKWYLKTDIEEWESGDAAFSPEYNHYEDKSLPKSNFLLSKNTIFLNLNISPFY